MSASTEPIRIFVDSNVLIEGLFAPWSASRAILILARVGVFRLVLSPYVEAEVERALLNRLARDAEEGSRLIDDYALTLQRLAPERTERITREEFDTDRSLIRHGNDVPVLVTAMNAAPTGWSRRTQSILPRMWQHEPGSVSSPRTNCLHGAASYDLNKR